MAVANEGAEQYPYDPALRGREESLQGLEKLRAFEDRVLAQKIYDIYMNKGFGKPRQK